MMRGPRNQDVDECVAVVGAFTRTTLVAGSFLAGGVVGGGRREREREWWEAETPVGEGGNPFEERARL